MEVHSATIAFLKFDAHNCCMITIFDSFKGFVSLLSSNTIEPYSSTVTSNELLLCGGTILSTTTSINYNFQY